MSSSIYAGFIKLKFFNADEHTLKKRHSQRTTSYRYIILFNVLNINIYPARINGKPASNRIPNRVDNKQYFIKICRQESTSDFFLKGANVMPIMNFTAQTAIPFTIFFRNP